MNYVPTPQMGNLKFVHSSCLVEMNYFYIPKCLLDTSDTKVIHFSAHTKINRYLNCKNLQLFYHYSENSVHHKNNYIFKIKLISQKNQSIYIYYNIDIYIDI